MSAADSIRLSGTLGGTQSRLGTWLRVLVLAALLGSVAWAVAGTLHWPIVGDAPLLHYVCFLMDHGKLPYRDVFDMDMPGTYALEWAAIHLLGPGALAWRFTDFVLVAVIGGAMVAISLPVDWLAGAFAGAMFALIHFRDGPTHTGQRDLMMTAMLLPACALLFWARREATAIMTISRDGWGTRSVGWVWHVAGDGHDHQAGWRAVCARDGGDARSAVAQRETTVARFCASCRRGICAAAATGGRVVVAAWGAGGVRGDVSRDCAVPRVLGKAIAGVAGGGELSFRADGDHFARDSRLRCAAALEELGGRVCWRSAPD